MNTNLVYKYHLPTYLSDSVVDSSVPLVKIKNKITSLTKISKSQSSQYV